MTRFPKLELLPLQIMSREYRVTDNENINRINNWQNGLQIIEGLTEDAKRASGDAKVQAKAAEDKVDNQQSQLDTLVSGVTDGDEVIQMRVNTDGVDKGNAKTRVDDDFLRHETKINDIAVNVKTFGVIGNANYFNEAYGLWYEDSEYTVEAADDTAAIQEAFDFADKSRLQVPEKFRCLVTGRIDLPDNIIIDAKGSFILEGDEDYWFAADTPEQIVVERFGAEVRKSFEEREKLNRVFYCDDPDRLEIQTAAIAGASTAVHCLQGEEFVCGNILLVNVYGTEAQYGYGLNSSAKRSKINHLTVLNDSSDHGRHAIYINGDQWEDINIGKIYVKNWNKNPVNFTNTNMTAEAKFYLGAADFIDCNMVPTDSTNGCIHGTGDSSAKLTIYIGDVRVKGIKGPAVSSMIGYDGFYLNSLYAEELPEPYNENTALIYLRGGTGKRVGRVYCTALNTGWLTAVSYRDTTNAIADDIYIGGGYGTSAVRIVDSTAMIGSVQTDNIPRVYDSGSNVYYKQLKQTIRYAGSPPSDGAFEEGDITWDTSVNKGDYIGWVCVDSGNPGTWARFGYIDKGYAKYGNTSSRPSGLTSDDSGFEYYDTQIEKPIWWDGADSKWVTFDAPSIEA